MINIEPNTKKKLWLYSVISFETTDFYLQYMNIKANQLCKVTNNAFGLKSSTTFHSYFGNTDWSLQFFSL